jgi:hypothetical protein
VKSHFRQTLSTRKGRGRILPCVIREVRSFGRQEREANSQHWSTFCNLPGRHEVAGIPGGGRGCLSDGIVLSQESRSFGLWLNRRQHIGMSRRGVCRKPGAPELPKVASIPEMPPGGQA